MIYIDQQYISLLKSRLRNFKQVKDNFNFSCPLCGDSAKNDKLARAWFYKGDAEYNFKCYNCDAPVSFFGVFKKLDNELFKKYLMEKRLGSSGFVIPKAEDVIEPVIIYNVDILSDLLCIEEFEPTHPVIKYVNKRLIPKDKWNKIYFAPRFMRWVNSVKPDTFNEYALKYDHPRLVFPFFNVDNKPFGFSARAFGKETPKYLVIKLDDNEEKIYGLESVDFSKRFYITEGQIDSLFIPNCIAAGGSSFSADIIRQNKSNAVIVYDNEPRSKEIMNSLEKLIFQGYKVFIWPDNIKVKDINDLVKTLGYTQADIIKLLEDNTYHGLWALNRYKQWRKVK